MQPVLFQIFGWQVEGYALFITLGYLAALALVRHLAISRKLPVSPYIDICFLALISGAIGGRLLFVLTNWEYFSAHPGDALRFWGGGVVFFGGFLLALPCCWAYLRWRKLPLAPSLDLLAPALALGHALGRIGCFCAGCCHGSYCTMPWAVRMYSSQVQESLRGEPIHPTQLYESAGLFLLAGFLVWLFRRRPRSGIVAASYAVLYAALRFGVEFLRGDSIRGTLAGTPFSTSQVIAIGLFFGGGWFLARAFRRDH